jgi:hypothetical protein
MRTALIADGHVDAIAARLNDSAEFRKWCCWGSGDPGHLRWSIVRNVVVGALHGFWSRMQEITTTGDVPYLSPEEVDIMLDCPGFADAMVEIGWLKLGDDNHIIIPNWTIWNGSGTKKRLLEARKKRISRSKACPQNVPKMSPAARTNVPPTEENRRDKKKSTSSSAEPRKPDPIWDTVEQLYFGGRVVKSQQTGCGKLVAFLKSKQATPDEIRARRQRLVDAWGSEKDTVNSIRVHWDKFDGRGPQPKRPGRAAAPPGKYDGR